jgi:hypothetical protein
MRKILTFGTLVVLAIAFVATMLPANASLVATSFGFPVIVQSGTTTAFNQDAAAATDIEATAINFPTAAEGVLPFGAVNLAFPSITQNVVQTQTVTHTDFAQTNENAEFAYPFVGVGCVSLPGFGFGF